MGHCRQEIFLVQTNQDLCVRHTLLLVTPMFFACSGLTSLDLSDFTFTASVWVFKIFLNIAQNVEQVPINIYVTSGGKTYLEGQLKGIDENYAQLVVKATLNGQNGGSW